MIDIKQVYNTQEMPKKKPKKRTVGNILTDEVAQYLLKRGYIVMRINSGVARANKRPIPFYFVYNNKRSSGMADLVAMKDSRAILIEIKAGRDVLRDGQRDFAMLCRRHGMDYVLCTSLADVEEYIRNGIVPELPPKKRHQKTINITPEEALFGGCNGHT